MLKQNLFKFAYNDWVWFNSLSKKSGISYDRFDYKDDIFVWLGMFTQISKCPHVHT